MMPEAGGRGTKRSDLQGEGLIRKDIWIHERVEALAHLNGLAYLPTIRFLLESSCTYHWPILVEEKVIFYHGEH